MSSGSNHDADFRFYVCTERQDRQNTYECGRVSLDAATALALERETKSHTDVIRTVVVPINKHIPAVFDYMYINSALKPSFYIVK